jgi:Spy/CpxP family protein refolding chaperone
MRLPSPETSISMRLIIRLGVVLLLLSAPTVVDAQQRPAEREGGNHPQLHGQPPHAGVGFLLRHRGELQLTDGQIARLRGIARQLEERNAPLLEQLRVAGIPVHPDKRDRVSTMAASEKEALREKLESCRPALRQLQANTQNAMEEVRSVLTPAQRERFRSLLQENGKTKGEARNRGRAASYGG